MLPGLKAGSVAARQARTVNRNKRRHRQPGKQIADDQVDRSNSFGWHLGDHRVIRRVKVIHARQRMPLVIKRGRESVGRMPHQVHPCSIARKLSLVSFARKTQRNPSRPRRTVT